MKKVIVTVDAMGNVHVVADKIEMMVVELHSEYTISTNVGFKGRYWGDWGVVDALKDHLDKKTLCAMFKTAHAVLEANAVDPEPEVKTEE